MNKNYDEYESMKRTAWIYEEYPELICEIHGENEFSIEYCQKLKSDDEECDYYINHLKGTLEKYKK